ncbi:restriction endonuclease subunit S [Faecalibacterium duncaniae]|jgi:type I restriction enzyme S subunit
MARKMKDSGIEWIGEIPEGWEIKYFVQLFSQVKNKNIGLREKNLLSLSYGKIKQKSIETVGGLLPDNFEGYNIIDRNDIVLRLTDLQNDQHSLRVGLSPERGIITSAYCSIRVRGAESPNYLYYYLHTFDIAKGFYGMGSGVRQGLNWDGLKYIKILLPPQHEQDRISVFLNQKTLEIDSMLSKTISSIEEYKKLKQAVITQAVTKGVRGEREMKDSGVEWIGKINHRFSLIKLKYICSILDQYRKPISADKRSQSGSVLYDYYGASGAIDKIDDYTIDDHVMLIGEDGANLRMRNLPLMYEVNGKAWINNHAHILKPTERVDFYYLFYALEELDINPYITGSAQPKLSQEKLQNIWVPLPDLEEQQEIATYIRSKCAEIDGLIAKKEQLVKELESYKKSLIYEVVTGKREV